MLLKLPLTELPSVITATMTVMMTTARIVAYSVAVAADSPATNVRVATGTVWIGFFIMIPHFPGVSPFALDYFTNVGIGGSKKSTMDKDSSTWNTMFPRNQTVPPTTAPNH